ncbi:hypothetical protein T261_00202 [Streptomyces lydicus]|nr:hypothetical protein T261_00202 [Streptomyces lydicus]
MKYPAADLKGSLNATSSGFFTATRWSGTPTSKETPQMRPV